MTMPTSVGSTRTLTLVGVALSVVLASTTVRAQGAPPIDDRTRSAARALTEQGLALFDAGKYEAASDKLTRADELVRYPTTGLAVARVLAKLGKLVEASEKYLAVTKLPLDASASDAQRKAQETAASERSAILARLPQLELAVDPSNAEVTVTLDGVVVPRALVGVPQPVNPGRHAIAMASGAATLNRTIDLREGSSERIVLKALPVVTPMPPAPVRPALTPSTPTPSTPVPAVAATAASSGSGSRIGGGIAVGLGGAGLLTAGLLGLGTLSVSKDLTACTDDPACTRADQEDLLQRAKTLQTSAFVALGIGAAATTAGVVLLTLPSGTRGRDAATLSVGPTSARVTIRW